MAIVTTFLEPGTDATQDLSFFVSTAGTVASATDQVHTGTSALKFSTGAGPSVATATTANSILADSGSQISWWFFFDVLPASDSTPFVIVRNSTPSNIFLLDIMKNGTLKLAPASATSATGTTVLAVNTWYRISLSYYITNTTTYQAKLYINGTLEVTCNAGTLGATGTTQILWGASVAGIAWGANRNLWFDDLYVATGGASSSAQPDVAHLNNVWSVTAKRPNANGTTNNFNTQIGSGGSGYGSGHAPQVNERPLSTTNGWSIIAVGSAVTEEYNVEGAATGDVDISGKAIIDYMGWVYTKALAAETGQIVVNGASSNISITTSNAMFTKAAGSTTYPAGTGTDIGEVTDTTVTTVSLFECGLLFVYTNAPSVGAPYFYRHVTGGMTGETA